MGFLIFTLSYYANVQFMNPPHLLLFTLLYHPQSSIQYPTRCLGPEEEREKKQGSSIEPEEGTKT